MLVCGRVFWTPLRTNFTDIPAEKSSYRCREQIYPSPLTLIDLFPKGKTDVAMLTILRVLEQNRTPSFDPSASIASTIDRNAFKIVYV